MGGLNIPADSSTMGTSVDLGDLRKSLEEQGIDLDSFLSAHIDSLKGKGHLLLLGAPISRTVGAASSQIHWWAVELPPLAKKINGFRNTGAPYWKLYRNGELSDSKEVCWVETTNWSPSEISARGVFKEQMRSKTVTVIGAGALGSLLSEALVRGGVNKLVLVDNDALEIGNLTRHSLDMNYLGKSKSRALALRLNALGPFADTEGIAADIRRLNEEQYSRVLSSDVILDCTGNSDVLEFLERKKLDSSKLYASASLSAHAAKLYFFTSHGTVFPFSRFRELIAPLIIEDRKEYSEEEFPRDGVGCWHSVFPARYDQVLASIPTICQMLEDAIVSERKDDQFKVVSTIVRQSE